ncbi:MAG: hypothetical protein ACFFDU_10580 [Candidatus Thorarchaeota archaeon]
MASSGNSEIKKLLLIGSKAYENRKLPNEITQRIDSAIHQGMIIIVGEAQGAPRLYQDYLHAQGYDNVVVGHARSLRYNAGNWTAIQYGDNLKEREKNMIADCDEAIVIWMNKSGVIAQNLERLKFLEKPTFLYECYSHTPEVHVGPLDPNRVYDQHLYWKFSKQKS